MNKQTTDPKDQKQEVENLLSDKKQSEKIVEELSKGLKLFKDNLGNAYARIKINGHHENWPVSIKNKNFKIWVSYKGRKILGTALSENIVKEVIATLEGEALYDTTDQKTLFNRVGVENTADEYKLWYDLVNDEWSAIEITAKGWKEVKSPSTLFKRYQHQLSQVVPSHEDNDIRLLDKYLRLNNEQDRILIYVFLVTSLIANIPHVCLLLHGQQGSSKTTLFKILRLLVDPSRLEVISLNTDKRSFILNLDQNWFCPFDNVSGLKKNVSDILCQVITGAGFCDRTLYTDDDPFIRSIKRVVGLNGINVAAAQPDLLERSIMIELSAIDKKSRLSEEDIWKNFTTDKKKIFGGMLDVLSKAMSVKPKIVVNAKHRMADFNIWGEVIALAMNFQPGDFIKAYDRNMKEISEQSIDSNFVAAAIKGMVNERVFHEAERGVKSDFLKEIEIWNGAPAELVEELTNIAINNKIIVDEKEKYWPGKANAMSREINRIKPSLKSEGIIITTGERTSAGRRITIVYKEPKNTDLPIPPWKKNTNIKQNDDRVGNDDELDVGAISFK